MATLAEKDIWATLAEKETSATYAGKRNLDNFGRRVDVGVCRSEKKTLAFVGQKKIVSTFQPEHIGTFKMEQGAKNRKMVRAEKKMLLKSLKRRIQVNFIFHLIRIGLANITGTTSGIKEMS